MFDFIESDRYRNQPWNPRPPRDTTPPVPFFPGEGKNVGNLQVTPDGAFVLMTISEPSRSQRRITMPLWITADGYLTTFTGRNLVGDEQGSSRAAILDVATGRVTYVGDSIGTGDRSISGVAVSPTSGHALLRVTSDNRENQWYAVVDLPSLTVRQVAHNHDPAWVGSPGPGLFSLAGFLPDGETVYFGSERTGFIHLYRVPAVGGEPTAMTSGEWEVQSASLSPDGRTWYLETNREGPHNYHVYTMPMNGGPLAPITNTRGRQDGTPSPDGRWLAVQHSTANAPPELYVQELRAGRPMRRITTSTTEEFRRGPWIEPEIVWVTASDGVRVPARLYRPTPDTVPVGRKPAVIFVHGAGYLQNVHNWWSSYSREYMFHHVLAAKGYTVLDMDYRASSGYGRDWRTAIYRHMGGRDLQDNVDGARWLTREMGIDSTRIGIYGGSYGGFITLMGLFTTPGVFAAGAALRPVTDWAHYNHGYTSAILNEPQDDTLAYRQSSPIYFAQDFEGELLMAHGMVDDNVLFYDTARLTQRLIELGKSGWETAMYPVERHGFTEIASWRDEYRRIFELFERVLKRR
ncbi:MAG: prolyl oligopeptidase family serine peptidase [Gemmatimonadales bacterium]